MENKGFKKVISSKKGNVFLSVVWLLLILSGMLISLNYPLLLQNVLVADFLKEQNIRGEARDLLQIVIHHLQNDESEYDTQNSIDFSSDLLEEMGCPDVTIELWDEGSRLNLNNTPISLWQRYFYDRPEHYQTIHAWFFPEEGDFRPAPSLTRQNYLFCNEDLLLINEEFYPSLLPEFTLFGPANFYLLDGESFLSILYRAGEDFSAVTKLAIIDAFNQKREETMRRADLMTLISLLQIQVTIDPEKIKSLVTTDGMLNPNFINSRFLNAIWGKAAEDTEKAGDLRQRQIDKPFTTKEAFEDYLKETYGAEIPIERIWLLFTLKTKIWGVHITLSGTNGPTIRLTAILHRERENQYSRWKVKILSLQERWV